MNKLHKIIAQVTEVKIGKPIHISKDDLLDWWFKNDPYTLGRLTQEPNVDALVQSEGYDNLEGYLIDNYGYGGESLEKVIKYIEYYYKLFKHKEIYVETFGDGNGMKFKSNGVNYAFIDISYRGNEDYIFYAHN